MTLHDTNPKIPRGGSKEFRLSVDRIDQFDGPVSVALEGLPPGITSSSPIVIEAGQIEAYGVLHAAADAADPTEANQSTSRVSATAMIGRQEQTHHSAGLGKITLEENDKLRIEITAAESGPQPKATHENGLLEFEIQPGETILLNVKVDRQDFGGEVSFGKEDAGRNLPHGLFVDNIGLNGLLLLSGQTERDFFVTAAPWVPEQSRLFHLRSRGRWGPCQPSGTTARAAKAPLAER